MEVMAMLVLCIFVFLVSISFHKMCSLFHGMEFGLFMTLDFFFC